MARFTYRARDRKGALVAGELDGISSHEVKSVLGSKGLIPIAVTPMSAAWQGGWRRLWVGAPSLDDLAFFTRQFYTLVKAGMDLDSALSTLSRQSGNPMLKDVLAAIRKSVAEGTHLSSAMAHYPKLFDDLYIGMIRAGEEAGLLEQILKELAELLESQQKTLSQIKSATFYPKLVLGLMTVVVLLMLTLVVPKFVSFYHQFNADLPLPTRMLIALVDGLERYRLLLLGLVVVGYVLRRKVLANPGVAMALDRTRARLPIFGDLYLKIYNARFSRILSALYRSGISLPRGLEIAAGVVGNRAFARVIAQVRSDVDGGRTLSEAMEGKGFFTPIVIDATAVGEKSGSLDDMLESIAGFYGQEVDLKIKKLTTLLEPLLLFVIFGGVALLVLAIYLPILNMNSLAL